MPVQNSDDGVSSAAFPLLMVAMVGGAVALLVGGLGVLGGVTGAQGSAAGSALAVEVMQAGSACLVSGPVNGLNAEQASNADTIVSAAFAASAENAAAARIALMAADTESGLMNLGPRPGNAGSLGLFQQRASQGWGTATQETDPADAAGMFVQRLMALPGWQTLPPWVAAQDVQRSAYDGTPKKVNGASTQPGRNYQEHWAQAGDILNAVLGLGNQPGACGQSSPGQGSPGQGSSGEPGGGGPAHGLPPRYQVPAGTGPSHAVAVSFAIAQLGRPYVWGAAGPGSFDCSGLTMAAWEQSGVSLLHYTGDQQNEGVPVLPSQLVAGDLVLIPGSDPPAPGVAGHVGLYLGYGLVISAVDPQLGVAVQSWRDFTSGGVIALRDPDPADA